MAVSDDAYARAAHDAEFLARVANAYTGNCDLLDALWWESHPHEVSPAGTPSPSVRLRELQHRVVSRAGGSFEDRDAYRALETEIARVLPTAIAAAAAIVAGVGFVGGMARDAIEGVNPAVLDVFDRPQTEQDTPAIPICLTIRHRRVSHSHAPDHRRRQQTVHRYATASSFGICAVVTTETEGPLSTSCLPAEDFATAGLTVHWSTDGDSSFDHMIRWDPNGDVTSQAIDDTPGF